jgi:hypothetical protein
MAVDDSPARATAPPPGEQIHLPGPTYQPIAVSIGSTLAIGGLVISYWILAAGLIITFIAVMLWVKGAREEFASLPLEH